MVPVVSKECQVWASWDCLFPPWQLLQLQQALLSKFRDSSNMAWNEYSTIKYGQLGSWLWPGQGTEAILHRHSKSIGYSQWSILVVFYHISCILLLHETCGELRAGSCHLLGSWLCHSSSQKTRGHRDTLEACTGMQDIVSLVFKTCFSAKLSNLNRSSNMLTFKGTFMNCLDPFLVRPPDTESRLQ